MPKIAFSVISTPRLRLEPFAPNHSKGIFRLWSSAEVCCYSGEAEDWNGNPICLPAREAADSDKILEFFIRRAEERSGVRWAVILEGTGKCVGAVGLNALTPVAELAYHFHQDDWGCGFAAESCSAVLEWVRESLSGTPVEAFVESENLASIRLLKNLGFVGKSTLRDGARRFELILKARANL